MPTYTPTTDLEKRIVESIRDVYDPEIPVNIYDLGLIYDVNVDENDTVHILMTLTAPNCPAAGILPGQVEDAARLTEGVSDARVELTFDPPFTPDMMSDEAKLELGFAIDVLRWYGEEGKRAYGRLVPPRIPGARQIVTKEPVGPCLAFVAWNFPAVNVMRKVAGALGAGV